jgi:hypothetical protein
MRLKNPSLLTVILRDDTIAICNKVNQVLLKKNVIIIAVAQTGDCVTPAIVDGHAQYVAD